MRPVRVLIVDDDPLVRAGLVMMLGGTDQVEVAGEASDGSEVLSAVDHHRPDVVLLDLRMPKVDGLAAMALLRAQPSPPRVLVLTTFDTDDQVLRALRAGAAGFLVKDTPPADIVRAIELVAAGESMLSPTVTRRLIERLAGEADSDAQQRQAVQRLASLSERNREIARGIGAGKPNAAIAEELHLSVATIKSHVSSMLSELGFENRVQIALMVQDAERGAGEA
ncbi:MAG TPA: response regulator transcription factor [Solirubrobacteraceae bacterium]|nr:response regulator transcription factor [Solirubrobacteraceae bacterium]